MTDHQKFKALIDRLGLSYKDIAEHIGMKHASVQNQLAPAKDLPKWALTMLLVDEKLKDRVEG